MQNNSFTAIPSLDNKKETKRFLLTLLMKIDELYGNRGDNPAVTSDEGKILRQDISTNSNNIQSNRSDIDTNLNKIQTNTSNIDDILNNDIILDGVKTFSKVFKISTKTNITAYSGGGQDNATQIVNYLNNITTCDADHDSIKLLDAETGLIQVVINNGTSTLDIYPNTNDSINNGSINQPIFLSSWDKIQLSCIDDTNWYSL